MINGLEVLIIAAAGGIVGWLSYALWHQSETLKAYRAGYDDGRLDERDNAHGETQQTPLYDQSADSVGSAAADTDTGRYTPPF